jgi:hypothetical protein
MAVGWSRPRDGEPDHPDQAYIVAAVAVDPGNPSGIAIARVPLEPVPYAPPDGLPEPGVIEPTQVFKPWISSEAWRGVTITYEEFE